MINLTGGAKTFCPYYRREGKLSIVCEGAFEDCDFMLMFQNKEKKREHQEEFCFCKCYLGCPVAQLALEKYESNKGSD